MKTIIIIGKFPTTQLQYHHIRKAFPINAPVLHDKSALVDGVRLFELDFKNFYPYLENTVDIMIKDKVIIENQRDSRFPALVYRYLKSDRSDLLSIEQWEEKS